MMVMPPRPSRAKMDKRSVSKAPPKEKHRIFFRYGNPPRPLWIQSLSWSRRLRTLNAEQRAFFHFDLLGEEQGAGFVIEPDGVEFDFVGNCGCKPRAADDAD